MRTEDIFYKVNKRNYNKTLENILDKKDFSEETKSLMLSMLYKIEINYDDYEKVKRIVANKNEFIERIIEIISGLKNIELSIKEQNESGLLRKIGALKTGFFVNEEYIYNQALTYVMNIGEAINTQEVVRNFTGWSWDNQNKEIIYEYENIVYQSLLMLVKNTFMSFWKTDKSEDYIENLTNVLKRLYGKELEEEIFNNLITASLQIAIKDNKVIKENFFAKYNKESEIPNIKLENITNTDIEKSLSKLQKSVLKGMLIDITKIDNIKAVIKYLYIIRYYIQIPFKGEKILDNEEILSQIEHMQKAMINGAYQAKLIDAFSTDRETNYKITKCLFECGVIDIEKIEILIKKIEERIIVEIYDVNNKDSEYDLEIDKDKINTIEVYRKKRLFI